MGRQNLLKTSSFLLVLCIIAAAFSGCGKNKSVSNMYRSVNSVPLESQALASNLNYELLWDDDGQAVIFKSLKNNIYWSDILYDSFLEGSTSANGNSPITITVANTKSLKWDTVSSHSQMGVKGNIVCKKIENGIRVTYFFDTYKIAIPIDYILEEESLKINIDSSKILEDGADYKLVAVSVAPFLCSVKNDSDKGSLFVPTGSGAIMYAYESPDGTRKYTGEVYGSDAARRNPRNLVDSEDIKLPVFGAYDDEKGLMGIIEQSAGSVEIDAQAGNARLGYSNIGATFYVRGYDDFFYIYHGKHQGITRRINEKISGQTVSISYFPLYGEQANYNGMAEKYRNYLLEKGQLHKSEESGGAYAVTLLGGTNISTSIFGIPNKKLVPLTTFSQASDVLKNLEDSVGVFPVVRMIGYGDNGIRTGSIAGGKKFPSAYGSKTHLKNLLDNYNDAQIFFDYDIVNFSKSRFGFLLNFDVAKTAISHNAEHFPVSPLRVNDKKNAFYILSREKLIKASELSYQKAKDYGIGSLSFSSLGSIAFSDFSNKNYINKNGIEEDVTKIFATTKSKGYKTASADANSYAACVADVLFDTTTSNGKYDVFDLEIPFYQMVFHSYKPMYTSAINLAENSPLALAKAAAYGMGLGYTLSHSYIHESNDLDEFPLYGTVYSDNASQIYKELVENEYLKLYSDIADSELILYEVDDNGVSKSTFDNGKIVYVNQTSNTVESAVGELKPYAFLVSWEGVI